MPRDPKAEGMGDRLPSPFSGSFPSRVVFQPSTLPGVRRRFAGEVP